MKARDVLGRRIVAVRQERLKTKYDRRRFATQEIELEGGIRLVPLIDYDLAGELFVEMIVAKKRRDCR